MSSQYKANFHVSKASSSTSSARTFSFLVFKTTPLVYIKASKPTTCVLDPLTSNVHTELLPTVGLQWRWSAQDPLRCYEWRRDRALPTLLTRLFSTIPNKWQRYPLKPYQFFTIYPPFRTFFFSSASNLPEGKAPRLQSQPLSSGRNGSPRLVLLRRTLWVHQVLWMIQNQRSFISDRHLSNTNSFHDISPKYGHAA